jgi:hypothetical protein
MIRYQHNAARVTPGSNAACCVCDDEPARAKRMDKPDRERNRMRIIPFIAVNPAAHHGNRLSLEFADHQLSSMSFHG